MASNDNGRAKVLARLRARIDRLEAALEVGRSSLAEAEHEPALPKNPRHPPAKRRQQGQGATA
jgi:hypothetical protein